MKGYLVGVLILAFIPGMVYGADITATPKSSTVGPNDWIVIDLKIDGYKGGDVGWVATKPDGTSESGTLTSFQALKKTHTISRTAFDNQFGTWKIDYTYNDIKKSVPITVEPLKLEILPDKQAYFSGDKMFVRFTTNYYEPLAAKAEDFFIEIYDSEGNLMKHFTKVRLKASSPVMNEQFIVDEMMKYNSYGTYKIRLQYYNTVIEKQFELQPRDVSTSIFVSTEKKQYQIGEIAQFQLILSKVTSPTAKIMVTNPSGIVLTKNVAITQSLSRILLDNVPLNQKGTYLLEVEYSGQKKNTSFSVEGESTSLGNELGFTMALNKLALQPGEILQIEIKSGRTVSGPLTYWLEGPENKKTPAYLIQYDSPGLLIPYPIPKDITHGAWKIVAQFKDVTISSLFVVAGSPVEPSQQILKEVYTGPKILLNVDNTIGNFKTPSSLAIDSTHFYVLDSGNSEIKKFDQNGRLVKSWGSFGSSDGQLKNPSSIMVDTSFVYVADTGNSKIQIYDKEGKFVKSWGKSDVVSESLSSPAAMAKDMSGVFYIADKKQPEIKKFDQDGNYLGAIKYLDTAAAKFSSSDFVVIDKNNNLYILSSADNRILHYKTDGTFVGSFGTSGTDDGKLQNPTSLALDSMGNLYVADSGNNRVHVFEPNGKFLNKWGAKGTGDGKFNQITGVTLDNQNNVFVVDSQNLKIQKFAAIVVSNEIVIPDWVRNNAAWWNEGKLADTDFASGIKFMIEKKIIQIPTLEKSGTETGEKIPDWVKNNAKWWAEGKLTNKDFASGIEFMVKKGIIRV